MASIARGEFRFLGENPWSEIPLELLGLLASKSGAGCASEEETRERARRATGRPIRVKRRVLLGRF